MDIAEDVKGEWQDIATAPKTWEPVLAVVGGEVTTACYEMNVDRWSLDTHDLVSDANWTDRIWCEPTHWMPLPAPPIASTIRSGAATA